MVLIVFGDLLEVFQDVKISSNYNLNNYNKMNTIQIANLSSKETEDIYGGSPASYNAGLNAGRALRQAIDNCTFLLTLWKAARYIKI